MLIQLFSKIIKKKLSLKEAKNNVIGTPKKILVVRQHNQFGDLLASVPVFRAIKETYPNSHLTVIVSPANYYAVTKNKFIDSYFLFNKIKLFNPSYLIKFIKLLKSGFDLSIVPVTVSISFTSCLIARISKSACRIGPKSLNGKINEHAFLFDRRVDLDWSRNPDVHVSDFGLEILRPFGIITKDFRSNIEFDEEDIGTAEQFIGSLKPKSDDMLVGLHVGAGKTPNRWALDKFIKLQEELLKVFPIKYYFTGSDSDRKELNYIRKNSSLNAGYFINRKIPELAALISKSDLFITNDTGVMHVAGATNTPQISIFGPTNPFNWAPIGKDKYFVRKSEFIDDVTLDDVLNICKMVLNENKKKFKNES